MRSLQKISTLMVIKCGVDYKLTRQKLMRFADTGLLRPIAIHVEPTLACYDDGHRTLRAPEPVR